MCTATAASAIYTLSLHDALPICRAVDFPGRVEALRHCAGDALDALPLHPQRSGEGELRSSPPAARRQCLRRSEEHRSELQSHVNLVCRLLLEKKKNSSTSQELSH